MITEDLYIYLDPPYARFDESKGEDDAKDYFGMVLILMVFLVQALIEDYLN
jgi:hypothetical protein